MPLSREITKPTEEESMPVLSWKHSLRDKTPQKSNLGRRSPSPNRGNIVPYLSDTNSSRKRDKLRVSNGNLTASLGVNGAGKALSKSVELAGIEQEYIKNLQQQIYFLELETNYLREQSRKATEMHPVMTAEAERMLGKLRSMETVSDGLRLEITRKENHIDVLTSEKVRLLERIQSLEDNNIREKSLIIDEVITLKKDNALLERDLSGKSVQFSLAEKEKAHNISEIRSLQQKVNMLRDQVEQSSQQLKLTQDALEEKSVDLARTENKLREVEERYYNTSLAVQEKVSREFRDDIVDLRRKLKESEYAAEQERHLRNKISEDGSSLLKENSLLTQQVHDLQSQVLTERDLREGVEGRRSMEISELLLVKDQNKQLQLDLESLREQLRHDQERSKIYLEQLAKQEQLGSTTSMNLASLQNRLNDLEKVHQSSDTANSQLRRDKMLLVDHITELQKQMESKVSDNIRLLAKIQSLEKRFSDLERQKFLETSLQSKKWGELENLAESMKNLSHTMSKSPTMEK